MSCRSCRPAKDDFFHDDVRVASKLEGGEGGGSAGEGVGSDSGSGYALKESKTVL